MSITRNQFLKVLGTSTALTLTGIPGFSATRDFKNPSQNNPSFKLGLASYTLRKFTLDEVVKICKRLGLTSVALKSMHMPLESSGEDIKAMAEKIKSAGLNLYGAGVIYMKSATEVESAFEYASHAGLEMIVGVPNHDLLPLINEKVKKSNIKLAIHNHGPGDDLY